MASPLTRLLVAACLLSQAGCAVRQIPLIPNLTASLTEDTPRASGQVVALIMDPLVLSFRRDRDFSLTQEERYASGEHFMRSILPQLRARGFQVLEVKDEAQARELGAPYTLIPDAPGISVIRPKGLLDFSALGSINRVNVSYSFRVLKDGARVPERISGSASRTASFFWSNAALQTIGLGLVGLGVTVVIYGAWLGVTLGRALEANAGRPNPLDTVEVLKQGVPAEVAITVFVADLLVSQLTAQVVPRVVNPLVDSLVNEPRWESMVQAAHDDAVVDLADALARRFSPAPQGATP